MHLDVRPVDGSHAAEVERLIGLGARRADAGQGTQPWAVLADPEGNEFCVLGPLAAGAERVAISRLQRSVHTGVMRSQVRWDELAIPGTTRQQFDFLVAAHGLTGVTRLNRLLDGSRGRDQR